MYKHSIFLLLFLLSFPLFAEDKQDTDGDGIPDKKDYCPDLPGTKKNKGCPEGITPPPFEFRYDRDQDSVANDIDDCPDEAGLKSEHGCPLNSTHVLAKPKTSSKDSIAKVLIPEVEDNLNTDPPDFPPKKVEEPVVELPKSHPNFVESLPVKERLYSVYSDTDKDTVLNGEDKCPRTKGTVKTRGCPALCAEAQQAIADAAEKIRFEPYKNYMYSTSESTLLSIIQVLQNIYPTAKVRFGMHTDDWAENEMSVELATARKKEIVNFLVKNGLDKSRIDVIIYGRMRPLKYDYSEESRNKNRRIEVEFLFP
ncbi:MAG: OmpA family protein [Bacteroidia bacterium]